MGGKLHGLSEQLNGVLNQNNIIGQLHKDKQKINSWLGEITAF